MGETHQKKPNSVAVVILLATAALIGVGVIVLSIELLVPTGHPLFQEWRGHPSATIRNVAWALSVPIAVVGLYLAWRRTDNADRQAEQQLLQIEQQQAQIHQLQRANQNDRFKDSAVAISGNSLGERLSAIHMLAGLKREAPDIFHIPITQLFCDCLSREIKGSAIVAKPPEALDKKFSTDELILLLTEVSRRDASAKEIETNAGYRPKIINGQIPVVSISKLDLSDFCFINCRFGVPGNLGSQFNECDFDKASFLDSDISYCKFFGGSMWDVTLDVGEGIVETRFDRVRNFNPKKLLTTRFDNLPRNKWPKVITAGSGRELDLRKKLLKLKP